MKYKYLTDILIDRANRFPDQIAYSEVKSDLSFRKLLTNSDLLKKSRSIANLILAQATDSTTPVYIFCSSRIEFIELFWGVQISGHPAVPLNLPNFIFYKKQQKRILNILKKVSSKVGLYHHSDQDLFKEFSDKNPEIQSIKWICINDQMTDIPDLALPVVQPESTAVIQFTSGSTGNPKGVPLNHRQILSNLDDIVNHRSVDCFNKMVFWLPHNHDMGLFGGFLTAFYHGGETVLIRTQDYLKNPMLWLNTISKYNATCTPAPNFAFESLAKIESKASPELNLSSLKLIFNGAEFINYKTVLKFIDAYKKYHLTESAFCNSYGLAEATLMMSGDIFDRNDSICYISKTALKNSSLEFTKPNSTDAIGIVSCGKVVKSNQLVLSEKPIGKVLISGQSVTEKYFGNEDSDRFEDIVINGRSYKFFNTNDIGFIHNDQIFILGRNDDVIIHNGEKIFNSDIAVSVSSVSDLIISSSIMAYKVEETIKVAIELNELKETDSMMKKIQEIMFLDFLLIAEVVFLKKGYLPRTTSGKIIRKEAIEKIENEKVD